MNTELAKRFNTLAPWVTKFVIDGVAYGGSFDALRDGRITQLFTAFPKVKTILELGSLEGGHTLALARHPGVTRVVGLEGRSVNRAKARFVAELFKAESISFRLADLEEEDLTALGSFDAVCAIGVLYHLREPWRLLTQLARISPRLFLWTHVVPDDQADQVIQGYRGRWWAEGGPNDPLSGLSDVAFRPTKSSLLAMLDDAGWKKTSLIAEEADHRFGPTVTLAAESS